MAKLKFDSCLKKEFLKGKLGVHKTLLTTTD